MTDVSKMSEAEYLENRAEACRKYYSSMGSRNRTYNFMAKSLVIVFAASIPFVAGIDCGADYVAHKNIVLGALGTIVAILTGLTSFLKFQEKWLEYRSASERMKTEIVLYRTRATPYAESGSPFGLFVTNIENIISTEHSTWRNITNENK